MNHRIPRPLQPFFIMGAILYFFTLAVFGLLAEMVMAAGAAADKVEFKGGGWK